MGIVERRLLFYTSRPLLLYTCQRLVKCTAQMTILDHMLG
jgi:hypothetical protein